MKADLTRITFDRSKQFSRVLMQQGRVQIDADWNEQVAILLQYMQDLAADIIGPYGGPQDNLGFEIFTELSALPEEEQERRGGLSEGDFVVGSGRYYVDGVLCENGSFVAYTDQPDLPGLEPPESGDYLVYLDVWERHVTAIEDPDIREVALGSPDTAARAKVMWQVKVDPGPEEYDPTFALDRNTVLANWNEWIRRWQPAERGMLEAKGRESTEEDRGDGSHNHAGDARRRAVHGRWRRPHQTPAATSLGSRRSRRFGAGRPARTGRHLAHAGGRRPGLVPSRRGGKHLQHRRLLADTGQDGHGRRDVAGRGGPSGGAATPRHTTPLRAAGDDHER